MKCGGKREQDKFYSGRGSLEEFSAPYVEWITKFIFERDIKVVIDLGCGDFRVGQRLCAASSIDYIGVDIVPELIVYNQAQFGNEHASFRCTNIIDDELPGGELCLIRQVLQHLSNDEIRRVIANCKNYRYLLVTEDVYAGKKLEPNLDMSHGPDTRTYKQSGVFLELAPFNLPTRCVLEISRPQLGTVIRTCLIEQKPSIP